MRPLSTVLHIALVLNLLPSAFAFSCSFDVSGVTYDLNPLTGGRTADKQSETPPTTSEARVSMELCAESGVAREDGVSDEDQCPPNTRVCLKLVNHKSSAPDPDRVTAVIPFWPVSAGDDRVWATPMGKGGRDGLKIWVEGDEYAGQTQNLNLTLLCDPSAVAPSPTLVSYVNHLLSLEWASPDACPRTGDYAPGTGESSVGFFGFLRFMFWLGLIVLIMYFAIGVFYNHQQYSARGWDLIPHKDFWREFPTLVQDLVSHVVAGFRGSGAGRGGYHSLG